LSGAGSRLWLGVAAGVIAVLVAAWFVNSMLTPATRAGKPVTTVAPLPVITPTATPTPTAIPSGSPSASPTPSAQKPKVKSTGDFTTASLAVPPVSSSGELRDYALRVETGAKLKANAVARQVAGVLNDPRSWAGSGGIRFGLVADPQKADFTVTVAAPGTAAKLCAVEESGTCTSGSEVVIDAATWLTVPASYAGNPAEWHAYLVNNGLGHLLGERVATCSKKAKPAPVMMPQAGDLGGCLANPWPYP
ncbi:MAG: DUF3152 domain-containing protein, partial [Propionicimonas sp.]